MYEHFERIPAEEKTRILQACIGEFSRHGYRQASTNAIVQHAGIPKGTLFYYFGSKKNLYLYLMDHAVSRFLSYLPPVETLPADLFERLMARGSLRMQFALQEPELYRLFYNLFLQSPDELRLELQSRFAGYAAASQSRLLDGLDASKLKPGVDLQQAVGLVSLVMEGVYNRYMSRFQQGGPQEALALVEQVGRECQVYFNLLQTGLYRDP